MSRFEDLDFVSHGKIEWLFRENIFFEGNVSTAPLGVVSRVLAWGFVHFALSTISI
jgi:hypothetical protein